MNGAASEGKAAAGKRGGKSGSDTAREPDFETSLRRLEEIVARLEAGEMPLEETLRLFEEGQVLVGTCGGLLERAEQRVKELVAGTGETRDLALSGSGTSNAAGDAAGRPAAVPAPENASGGGAGGEDAHG